MTSFLRVVGAVARKDLRTELRSREMLPALGQFVVLALLIAFFGFDVETGGLKIAPGVLWLTVTFAGLVAFGRTFAAERDQASLEPLLLTPASRSAIFAGKALAAALVLAACEAVLVPAMVLSETSQRATHLILSGYLMKPLAWAPEIPPEQAAILKRAFMATHGDPQYLREAKDLQIDVSPLPGDEIQKILARIAKTPPALVARYNAILNAK